MIVFFERAMITGLPLQNKLRTYKKKEEKKQRQSFFSVSRASTPSPPPTHTHIAKPDDPRVDIRYRGGIETINPSIVLSKSNDHVFICLVVNIEIKTVGWHIEQSGLVLKTV